jgi:UDP-glucose 4-epimerase
LLTGGAGFIGSHTALALLKEEKEVVFLDNFSNSSELAIAQILKLSSSCPNSKVIAVRGDVRSPGDLDRAFTSCPEGERIDAVIHFAGVKSVSESVANPIKYWDINVAGTISLVNAMRKFGCKTLIFSSSCTIYGETNGGRITETTAIKPINPYGHSKATVEEMLRHLASSEEGWRISSLRYFNPVGAHPSGLIGENPTGMITNLFPLLGRIAIHKKEVLEVYGTDWPTPDGTCIRDYIHVVDLAEAHVAMLKFLLASSPQIVSLNLGTGQGYSVFEVIKAYESVCGFSIPFICSPRRFGDAALAVADPSAAQRRIGWESKSDLRQMCEDSWNWCVKNNYT